MIELGQSNRSENNIYIGLKAKNYKLIQNMVNGSTTLHKGKKKPLEEEYLLKEKPSLTKKASISLRVHIIIQQLNHFNITVKYMRR